MRNLVSRQKEAKTRVARLTTGKPRAFQHVLAMSIRSVGRWGARNQETEAERTERRQLAMHKLMATSW